MLAWPHRSTARALETAPEAVMPLALACWSLVLGAVAGHAHHVQDDGVMDNAIDGSDRCHGIFEGLVPVRKNEV